MGYRNELELRPHVGRHTHLMELIGNGRCWHFDAWIHGNPDRMYLRIETREGGRELLQRNVYRVHLGRSSAAGALEYFAPMAGNAAQLGELVTLQDRGLNPADRDALNVIHWNAIRPMLERRPQGFTSTSAAFHYVRAPSIEPMPDAVNFFAYGAN